MRAEYSQGGQQALAVTTAILFVLFLVMLPRYTDTAKTWYVLLILLATAYLALNAGLLRQTSTAERLYLGAILANFSWIAFCYFANGEPGRGASMLWGRHFYGLFVIPLFFLLRRVELPDSVILGTLVASATVSLGDILIDLAQGVDHRLQGMNPNAFGPIQLCLVAMLCFYWIERPRSPLRFVVPVAAAFAVATVVFSGSKNTWLSAILLGSLFAFYFARPLGAWRRLGAVAMLLLLFGGAYQLPIVQDRVGQGLDSIEAYFASDDYLDESRLGSFGTRMELWKTGWYVFSENPLIGVGVGGFKPAARANSERYRVNPAVHQYRYVHNQYLAALATRGLPGLLLFLAVMLLPLYIALSAPGSDAESRLARMSLVFICLAYLVGSVAEDHFEGKSAIMFSGVMLPLLLARISPGRPALPGCASPGRQGSARRGARQRNRVPPRRVFFRIKPSPPAVVYSCRGKGSGKSCSMTC